jgi:ketosteroid isomerase-like protein
MSQENIQTVKAMYEGFGRGDIGAVLGAMDPAIEWNEAENFIYADRNPYKGPDYILNNLFMRIATEWEGFKVIPQEFCDSGNKVIVFGRYDGTYRATGKPIHAQMVHVFTLAGGKVTKFQQYVDTAQVRDAVTA